MNNNFYFILKMFNNIEIKTIKKAAIKYYLLSLYDFSKFFTSINWYMILYKNCAKLLNSK